MNLAQVLYVLAVAKHRNFSRAAESLFLSQPALSQQVKSLEAELGYALFHRLPQGIALTEEGEVFCREAQGVAEGWERLQRHVQREAPPCRRLRIGMGSRVYSNELFEDVIRFFESHPELEVTFVTEAGQDFLSGLREGSLDLALDRLPPQKLLSDWQNYASWDLVCEEQCLLVAPDDPRRLLPGISFSQLQDCTMMSGLEQSIEDKTLKEECRKYGIIPRRIYRSDGIETIMNLVRSGKGVALGPRSFAAYYSIAAVPLLPESRVYLKFICLKSAARRPELALFRNYLLQLCRERGLSADGPPV